MVWGRTKNFYFSVREKHGKLLKELKYLSLEFNKVELQQCRNSFKKEKIAMPASDSNPLLLEAEAK